MGKDDDTPPTNSGAAKQLNAAWVSLSATEQADLCVANRTYGARHAAAIVVGDAPTVSADDAEAWLTLAESRLC